MTSHVTHIDEESWLEDPRFPDVALQLLVSKSLSPAASMIRVRVNAGGEIVTHIHETETEIVFIVNGEAALVMEGTDYRLTAGACAVIAPQTAHSLHNRGSEAVEILAIHSPPTR